MTKTDTLYLQHILDAIDRITRLIQGKNEQSFVSDEAVYNASLYLLAVIGEAVGNVSEEYKEAHQEIPWRDIKDMRNILIHEYFGVSGGMIWKTLQNRLPGLENVVRASLLER